MSKHRKWIVSKLRDASPNLLGMLDRSETDAFADSVRVDTYQDRERVLPRKHSNFHAVFPSFS